MLVQRLIAYTNQSEGALKNYSHKTVNWIAEIDQDGDWIGSGLVPAKKKMLVPIRERSGKGAKPCLLFDNAEYALGFTDNTYSDKDCKMVEEKHSSFCELIQECLERTGNPMVQAVLRAIQNPNRPEFPEELKAKDWIIFSVNDAFPHDCEDVQQFWGSYELRSEKSKGNDFFCIGCGELCTPVDRHSVPIKLPGGHGKGTKLISANERAYFSYNLENSLIAPTCKDCADKYATAFNKLLEDPNTHVTFGNLTYLFWTKDPVGFSIRNIMNNPDPTEVKELLMSPLFGSNVKPVSSNNFYSVAVSPYTTRIAVRDWMETTVENVYSCLKKWFEHQSLEENTYFSIYQLSASLYRDARKEMESNIPLYLMQHALYGRTLPRVILHKAVRRCVAERNVTKPRAALIKLYLLQGNKGRDTLMSLDVQRTESAYLCGRLFAQLERLQVLAVGTKTTIADRFYGSASTTPSRVFAQLLRTAQSHLGKLRREKPGLYVVINREIEEIVEKLNTFPRTLSLEQQGEFAIGYFHQQQSVYKKKSNNEEESEE